MSDTYFVYMMASNNRHSLYIGMTNDLERRISAHRLAIGDGFAAQYHCVHLVFQESFREVSDAIAREKQLKGWRREKKVRLIEASNPRWDDLAADWF
jgi:putative endonuclease